MYIVLSQSKFIQCMRLALIYYQALDTASHRVLECTEHPSHSQREEGAGTNTAHAWAEEDQDTSGITVEQLYSIHFL